MNDIKKHFLFLENGTALEQVKHEAKKRFKAKEFSALSEAQNTITRSLVNLPFNKASDKAKELSPFIIKAADSFFLHHDALFLPIKVACKHLDEHIADSIQDEHIYYYVKLCSAGVYLGADFKIDTLDLDIDVHSIKLADINCISDEIQNGWSVSLNEYTLTVKTTDDGIVADLWDNSAQEHELNDNTSYILYDELISFSEQPALDGEIYTDYDAAIKLEHDSNDAYSIILTCGGLDLTLSSTATICDEDGAFIYGSQITRYFENEADNKALVKWLHGQYDERFDDWMVYGSPYFGINNESGDPIQEVFDSIPAGLQDRILMLASSFSAQDAE